MGAARREGAGLVQHHGTGTAQPLQRASFAYDHPAPSGPGQSADDGHRHGQQQRARGRHDQYRYGPYGRTARRPREPGTGQSQGQEPRRVAIGQPHHGSAVRARRLGQPDDPRVRAVLGRGGGAQSEGGSRVHGAAAHLRTGRVLAVQGLTGEYGLVQQGGPRPDPPVHGYHLAGADHQQVAHDDVAQRHGPQLGPFLPTGGTRRVREQGPQVARGTVPCGGLQGPAGGQHEGDQRSGQELAHRQGAGQSQYRDHVDTGPAGTQRGQDPQQRREDGRHRARGPDPVGHGRCPRGTGDGAGHQRECAHHHQRHLRHPKNPQHPAGFGRRGSGGSSARAVGRIRADHLNPLLSRVRTPWFHQLGDLLERGARSRPPNVPEATGHEHAPAHRRRREALLHARIPQPKRRARSAAGAGAGRPSAGPKRPPDRTRDPPRAPAGRRRGGDRHVFTVPREADVI